MGLFTLCLCPQRGSCCLEKVTSTGTSAHLLHSHSCVNHLYLSSALDTGDRMFDADCIDVPFTSNETSCFLLPQKAKVVSSQSETQQSQQQAILLYGAWRKNKTWKLTTKVINQLGKIPNSQKKSLWLRRVLALSVPTAAIAWRGNLMPFCYSHDQTKMLNSISYIDKAYQNISK